ncbi:hypothetical protein TSUD_232490 [Trifolium subterraneum]|uniref:Protein kinase domain-containing protein n=1 Tax=Trifolium subterraneum TaxID=3900 RepID=A0A2Z6LJ53_TRISU|nr:hypothetical protein TSUD_232490 [Trifolium subterraneum]
MNWVRGRLLGSGSFATVNLAIHTNNSDNFPSITAVKTSDTYYSHLLHNEKQILDRLTSSPYYKLKNYGGKLPETLVHCYTRSVLEGLKHVHESGFLHCDVKLQNILVMEDGNVKISDFGLAKEKGLKNDGKLELRGTPMFILPEAVNDNVYESPADIWALGCAVVEMITGNPAWNFSGSNIWSLLIRTGVGEELPLIPDELSREGKDFLQKIFVKDLLKRWTAEMLLKHPFISNDKNVSLVKELLNFPTEFE